MTATYSPEDNKLRLYVGRVPRDEYLKLRAEGWTSTPKQSCDFVATWTPQRRNTCLEYADLIEDEDQGPEDRAADRAERFGEYRDKRTSEATGHADNFDSGPAVHGYQSQARAERSARRHDRQAGYALDAWSKAEYWQRRTAGVIARALYKSTPGVRMGRIKTIEAELRKHVAEVEKRTERWNTWKKIEAITDPAKQTETALYYTGHSSSLLDWAEYKHPRTGAEAHSLYCLLSSEREPITGAEACALFFEHHSEPKEDNAWSIHYKMRLAYENQMLEAQGGRLEQCEVVPGGKFCGKLILKVNKSSATGRATSVSILGNKVNGWTYKASNIPGTQWAEHQFDLERYSPDSYTPPTPETLAELAEVKKAIKDAAPKKDACPLINPTDEDAERLQKLLNDRHAERLDEWSRKSWKPAEVCRCPQSVYSENAKGAYSRCETYGVCGDGELTNPKSNMWSSAADKRAERIGPALCKVRVTGYAPTRIVVLTDKPQKPFPAEVWEKYEAPATKTQQAEPVAA